MLRTSVWILVCGILSAEAIAGDVTTRISVDANGVEGDAHCSYPSISADGRYASFASDSSNLVAGDTNGMRDVFVRDQATGVLTRVSVASDGTESDGLSDDAVISADGRYVAFRSEATNLVSGDTNGSSDVYLHDCRTGTTVRASLAWDGAEPDDYCGLPSLSSDGRFLAFDAAATNMVPNDTNGVWDIFVRDMVLDTTIRVSVDSSGGEGDGMSSCAQISVDGRYVPFTSLATNLVAGDTNGQSDLFRHDLLTGVTERVSVGNGGIQSAGACTSCSVGFRSATGRYVAFEAAADDLDATDQNGWLDVYLRDMDLGTTTLVSVTAAATQGDADSFGGTVSSDGTQVVFYSVATNLVSGDTNGKGDLFRKDLVTGDLSRISVSTTGLEADGDNALANISDDGRHVVWYGDATTLVPGDTNGFIDDFCRSPELNLQAEPALVPQGSPLTFTTWRGASGTPGLLMVREVNGSPFSFLLAVKPFDAAGVMSLTFAIPYDPSLAGLQAGLVCFGFGGFSGDVLVTNQADITIQ